MRVRNPDADFNLKPAVAPISLWVMLWMITIVNVMKPLLVAESGQMPELVRQPPVVDNPAGNRCGCP
jgi:hypothetical protein